jgi:hypothetical protein
MQPAVWTPGMIVTSQAPHFLPVSALKGAVQRVVSVDSPGACTVEDPDGRGKPGGIDVGAPHDEQHVPYADIWHRDTDR